jgi:hypothetical protein
VALVSPVAAPVLELALWQFSETIFALSTLKVLLLESAVPLSWTVCPTWALRSLVFPASFHDFPDWSVNV